MVNRLKNGIVWIRTPKCATTTLSVHFEKFCKWKKMKYTPSTEHNFMPPTYYMNLGHLWAGSVNWDTVKRESRGVMASIRNPLDRFISHYKHNVEIDNRFKNYDTNVSSFYLENFHNTHFEPMFRGMDNYLCKYLGIGDDSGWDKKLFDKRYNFIFVTKYIKEGLENFEKLTEYNFEHKDFVTNTTSDTPQIITDEFINKFKDNNKNDYELYNYVLEKYEYR